MSEKKLTTESTENTEKKEAMSPTEEIQELGKMLTATTIEDEGRLNSIIFKLRQINAKNDVFQPAGEEWKKLLRRKKKAELVEFAEKMALSKAHAEERLNQLKGLWATDRPDKIDEDLKDEYFWEID